MCSCHFEELTHMCNNRRTVLNRTLGVYGNDSFCTYCRSLTPNRIVPFDRTNDTSVEFFFKPATLTLLGIMLGRSSLHPLPMKYSRDSAKKQYSHMWPYRVMSSKKVGTNNSCMCPPPVRFKRSHCYYSLLPSPLA